MTVRLSTTRHGLPWKLPGLAILLGIQGCGAPKADVPKIEFTRLPPAAMGGPDTLDRIAGRVTGARPEQYIVVYSYSGVWWVQPGPILPLTPIEADGSWKRDIHLGTEYAALLVHAGYEPPARTDALPGVGGLVVDLARAPGDPKAPARPRATVADGTSTIRPTHRPIPRAPCISASPRPRTIGRTPRSASRAGSATERTASSCATSRISSGPSSASSPGTASP